MKTPDADVLSISFTHNAQRTKAETYAQQYQLSCQPLSKTTTPLTLCYEETRVVLIDRQHKMSIDVDFTAGSMDHRRKYGGGKGQPLAKAVGIKQGKPLPHIIDATAGLARDSFVLACLGCPVIMLERSPVVAALVQDGLDRASLNSEFQSILQQGFTLTCTDAAEYLRQLPETQRPDVVYMDPMYPERKKSASVKKNMQILQNLIGKDEDTAQLLLAACDCARQRVVVKRPKGAPVIEAEKQPSLTYESKNTRYDVYLVPKSE